jgi:hypothetical protein
MLRILCCKLVLVNLNHQSIQSKRNGRSVTVIVHLTNSYSKQAVMKPVKKNEEIESGSDTETESGDDEDTVRDILLCPRFQTNDEVQIGVDRKSKSSSVYD